MLLLGLHGPHRRAAADLPRVRVEVVRHLAGPRRHGPARRREQPDEPRAARRPLPPEGRDRLRAERRARREAGGDGAVEVEGVYAGHGPARQVGGAAEVLRLAVRPQPEGADAREAAGRSHARDRLPPEAARGLADAAEAHRADALGPPAARALAGVGDHGLHLRGRPVAHAHVRAVRLDGQLVRARLPAGQGAVAVERPGPPPVPLGDPLAGRANRAHHRRGRDRRAARGRHQRRGAREGHLGAEPDGERARGGAQAVAARQVELGVEREVVAAAGAAAAGSLEAHVAGHRGEGAGAHGVHAPPPGQGAPQLAVPVRQGEAHRLGGAPARQADGAPLERGDVGRPLPQHLQEGGSERRHGARCGKIHLGSPLLVESESNSKGKGGPPPSQTNQNFMPPEANRSGRDEWGGGICRYGRKWHLMGFCVSIKRYASRPLAAAGAISLPRDRDGRFRHGVLGATHPVYGIRPVWENPLDVVCDHPIDGQ